MADVTPEVTAYGVIDGGLSDLVADARCVDLRPLDEGRPADIVALVDLRALPRQRRPLRIDISASTAGIVSAWD